MSLFKTEREIREWHILTHGLTRHFCAWMLSKTSAVLTSLDSQEKMNRCSVSGSGKFLLALASIIILRSRYRGILDHIFLSHYVDSNARLELIN
jgi:hypothetical protein